MTRPRISSFLAALALMFSLALLSACGRQTETPAALPEPTNTPAVAATPATAATPTGDIVASETPVAPAETPAAPNVEGVQWQVQSLAADGKLAPALPDVNVTIAFKKGDVSGNAGCNNYFGKYTLDGDKLTITAIGNTLMACEPQERMQQEAAYLAALGKVASYEISGNGAQRLILKDVDGNALLVYTAVESAPLAGTRWIAVAYNNGKEAVVSILAGSEITALFDVDGRLAGHAGCNEYMTTYTVDGNAITIAPAATTRMMCAEPDGVMDQEAAYLQALAGAATFEIENNTLTLLDANGARLAEFGTTPAAGAVSETVRAGADFRGIVWQWTETAYNNGAAQAVDEAAKYTVQFLPDGKLQLLADCNSGGGDYAVAGDALTLGPLVTTLKACLPDSLADKFLKELGEAASYSLSDGALVINLAKDAGKMKFAPVPTDQIQTEAKSPSAVTADLSGSSWKWLQTSSPSSEITRVRTPRRYTVAFLPDGKLKLRLDCNQGAGSYAISGSDLKIEVATTTRKACPPRSLADRFLADLNRAATYTLTDGNLVITLQADGGEMKFAPLGN